MHNSSASGGCGPDPCLIFILPLETPFEIPAGYTPNIG